MQPAVDITADEPAVEQVSSDATEAAVDVPAATEQQDEPVADATAEASIEQAPEQQQQDVEPAAPVTQSELEEVSQPAAAADTQDAAAESDGEVPAAPQDEQLATDVPEEFVAEAAASTPEQLQDAAPAAEAAAAVPAVGTTVRTGCQKAELHIWLLRCVIN
jgi:hypothetical protein